MPDIDDGDGPDPGSRLAVEGREGLIRLAAPLAVPRQQSSRTRPEFAAESVTVKSEDVR